MPDATFRHDRFRRPCRPAARGQESGAAVRRPSLAGEGKEEPGWRRTRLASRGSATCMSVKCPTPHFATTGSVVHVGRLPAARSLELLCDGRVLPGRAGKNQAGDNLRRDLEHHVHVVHVLRLLVGVVGVVGVVVVPVALVDAGVARRHRARLHAAGAPTFEFLGPAPSAGAERSRRAHSAGAERRRRRRAPVQSASAGCRHRARLRAKKHHHLKVSRFLRFFQYLRLEKI